MLKVSLSIHIITCKSVIHLVAVAAESFEVAYDVIGGEGTDDLMSPEQRRRLEESKKRKKDNKKQTPHRAKWLQAYLHIYKHTHMYR